MKQKKRSVIASRIVVTDLGKVVWETMPTKIYGTSDDLVEVEGDVNGEVMCYGTDDREKGVLLICSDGTLLEVKYGKGNMGIWGIMLIKRGSLLMSIKQCDDEEDDPYSDIAHFANGLKWVYAATDNWERVH